MLRKALDNLPHSRPYLIVTTIALALFFPSWIRLAHQWLEFEQVLAHGLATALIFIGLLVIHPPLSHQNRYAASRNIPGALLLVGITAIWVLLELVRIDTLAFLMLPVGMVAVCWALLGLRQTLSFLPYVLLLSLSLPFWADIVPALVSLASVVVGTWVRWFGMTALIEGNSITLPYGRLLIADGCSGIRYFAISILLAMMTSILNDYRWKGWILTITAAVLIGLLANWVRITILVFVAYQTDMQSPLLTDHELMGWIVYGAFIIPALYFSPVHRRTAQSAPAHQRLKFKKTGIVAVVAAIAIGPFALTVSQLTISSSPAWTLSIPEVESVQNRDLPLPISLPDTLEEDVWRSGGLWISLAQTQKQNAADKLVPYLPALYDDSTWQVEERLAPGLALYRNILTRKRVLMAQWYQVGERKGWSYREAKLLQIPAILGGENRFALVTLQMRCRDRDCQEAISRIKADMSQVDQKLKPSG
ncbi:MAG: exosortase/archaeosortase family protein [Marinobacter sp.]|nr:exosortase/archaeosortase family protein [Marinobacter sp.]